MSKRKALTDLNHTIKTYDKATDRYIKEGEIDAALMNVADLETFIIIHSLIQKGYAHAAYPIAQNLDTNVRDEIPNSTWDFMEDAALAYEKQRAAIINIKHAVKDLR